MNFSCKSLCHFNTSGSVGQSPAVGTCEGDFKKNSVYLLFTFILKKCFPRAILKINSKEKSTMETEDV